MRWLHWHVNIKDYRYPYFISVILLIVSIPVLIPIWTIAMIHNQELGVDRKEMMSGNNDYELSFHFNRQKDAIRFMRLINTIGADSYLSET